MHEVVQSAYDYPHGTDADCAMLSASASKRFPKLSSPAPLEGSSAMFDVVLTLSHQGTQQAESMVS